MTKEQFRLRTNKENPIPLEQWGPYVSERQWGTVREDYGVWGDAWNYFPFDQSHCRSYLWGEDGIAGISDFFQNLCFSFAFWNGKDPVLKERLFGLGNHQGNHGEDVKELYYHLDNLPTHSYMEYLYKYPQQEFPYNKIIEENKNRNRQQPEYEILDTGIFDQRRYFDTHITYAKNGYNDISIRIEVTNRYSKSAEIHILPTLWFFNRWQLRPQIEKPNITLVDKNTVKASHKRLGDYYFYFPNTTTSLFTDNETNTELVKNEPNKSPFTKDAFHRVLIKGEDPEPFKARKEGTKFSPVYKVRIPAGATKTLYFRLCHQPQDNPFPAGHKQVFEERKKEADEFYESITPVPLSGELKRLHRQALAGILWNKQFYYYDIEKWLTTTDGITPVNDAKKNGRNSDWKHLKNQDIISMPDKWEYPWYAAWDLAFHCIPLAMVDPTFAKHQLLLIMREWYMKPDGQLPAYEWNFNDVNPPVQAWAAVKVYRIEKKKTGAGDIGFLKRAFQKLLINFTWWINRKDRLGNNLFEGGFLGLDNIGVFDRSFHYKGDMQLEQADGTSWMGTFALDMMDMALEIAVHDISFEDTATKFFEHFILIAEALNQHHLWNDEDKFFYDVLNVKNSDPIQLKVRSIVGLSPLFAVTLMKKEVLDKLKDFDKRITWFEKYRKRNGKFWPNEERSDGEEILLSLVPRDRLIYLLEKLLDEEEFLSPGGIRALSKYHEKHQYSVNVNGLDYNIRYDPGDATSDMFGGNSNWRGPVWIPINFLIIQSIQKYGQFYGDTLMVDYPTGSGNRMNLTDVAKELTNRVISLFQKDENGDAPTHGDYNWFYKLPENNHLNLFYEYFHGDSGRGLGASHQTGWTSLLAFLIEEQTAITAGKLDIVHDVNAIDSL